MKMKLAFLAALVSCTAAFAAPAHQDAKNIVDTAKSAGSFQTLVKALQAADLVSALEGPGPFTVFAPTDEAFAKLPAGALDNLLKPENKEKLRAVLMYHVVSGRVTAAQAAKLSSAKALEGEDLKITRKDDGIIVNDAHVIKADVAASNGVIHVIDAVLMPNAQ